MVRIRCNDLDKGIKLTKMRIAHLEKHGDGGSVMQEKQILKKQERQKQLLKERGIYK